MIPDNVTQLIVLRENVNVSFYLPQILTVSTNVIARALQKVGSYSYTEEDRNGNFSIKVEEEREFLNRRYDKNLENWFKNGQPRTYSRVDDEDFDDMLWKVESLEIGHQPIIDQETGKFIGFITEPMSSRIDDLI